MKKTFQKLIFRLPAVYGKHGGTRAERGQQH
jgi:hypothetical protein